MRASPWGWEAGGSRSLPQAPALALLGLPLPPDAASLSCQPALPLHRVATVTKPGSLTPHPPSPTPSLTVGAISPECSPLSAFTGASHIHPTMNAGAPTMDQAQSWVRGHSPSAPQGQC